MTSLPVRGEVRRRRGMAPLLVLSQRLDGHDTFLQADLALDPDGATVRVRIHTFDDLTVLHPTDGTEITGKAWTGLLRLRRERRRGVVPPDLVHALTAAGTSLDALDEREQRHLLGYLADAADPATHRARIVTIVAGLHGLTA
jgi:hypothetical protein